MTKMTLRLICPNLRCRRILAVPVAARGKVVRCGRCGIPVLVPAAGAGSDPPQPAAASAPDTAAASAQPTQTEN